MMSAAFYRDRWQEMKDRRDEVQRRRLPEEIALAFLDRHFFNDSFETDYIQLLCEMATSAEDETLACAGAGALFGIVVESLCDDFEELQTKAYNRLMSQILTYCRAQPGGEALDSYMNQFGLREFDDLYRRAERLRKSSCNYRDLPAAPSKILLLSRVTLGADVAITSVLVQRFARLFPDAEIVIIGSAKVHGLFAGNPRIRLCEVNYLQKGGLMERLESWFQVLQRVDTESHAVPEGQMLLVDPDSRLSQLGVLPLTDDRHYLFFNSRGSLAYDPKMSVSEMANHWFDQVTGSRDFCYPALSLEEPIRDAALRYRESLLQAGCRRIVSMNLGVGGNSRKRIDGSFEQEAVLEILDEASTVLLLDRGFGDEELARTGNLLDAARRAGHPVLDTSFAGLMGAGTGAGLVGIQAGIAEAAALIGVSHEYIGYDSACQHLAAAMDVTTYTIFAGSNNTRFVRRWRPFGLGRTELILVDTLTHSPVFDAHTVCMRLMHLRRGTR
ncbi:MAG: hypothetical protein R3231_13275 [bacterium]|nr:hypothetical protein [bacterium]